MLRFLIVSRLALNSNLIFEMGLDYLGGKNPCAALPIKKISHSNLNWMSPEFLKHWALGQRLWKRLMFIIFNYGKNGGHHDN